MANVDYDPVKAHEYYMKHRKLKGKHSQKGFSQQQREQWAYAKSQLQEQKKARDESNRNTINASKDRVIALRNEAKKKGKEQLMKAATAKIDAIRQRLTDMTPEQRRAAKAMLQGQIKNIRANLREKKSQIQARTVEQNKATRQQAQQDRKTAREKSKATYEAGLDSAYERIKGKARGSRTALYGQST